MSFDAIRWALAQQLPALQKLVLICLSDCVNVKAGNNECWPSQQQIAKVTGLTRQSVNKQIQGLVAADLLEIHRQHDPRSGHKRPSLYALSMPSKVNDVDIGQSQRELHPKSTTLTSKVNDVDNYKEYESGNNQEYTKKDARENTRGFVSENVDKSNPKKSTRRAKQDDRKTEVPDWLPKSAWQEWLKHRKQIKSPMTAYAQALLIKKLDGLRAKHDPVELLETAIVNGWKSVYEPRGNGNGTGKAKLSTTERSAKACNDWYESRHGKPLDADERQPVEIHGTRLQ